MRIPVLPETRSEDLPPMRVNTVTMVLVGIAVWVLALAVVLIMRARGSDLAMETWICLTGIGFGGVALGWAIPQQRRTRRREAAASRAADEAAGDR